MDETHVVDVCCDTGAAVTECPLWTLEGWGCLIGSCVNLILYIFCYDTGAAVSELRCVESRGADVADGV
jgi:hypothetical protein